jgi:prolipoprotein diacylglyceryl transferase
MLRTYAGYRSRVHPVAYLPSPSQSVWHLGPIPIRAYALCIVLGIIVALWLGTRRMRERGGTSEDLWDVAGWAIVLGIIGGRLYHVVTDPELYFKAGESPINALKIWDGGLGIWGAIALGAFGAWIGCRRHGLSFLVFADIVAPGIVLAQGIGRWGNWFNNELYGGRTDLPWGLTIHEWDQAAGHAVRDASGKAVVLGTFHPTFLYESMWCLLLALFLVVVDRRRPLRRGQLFGLYVAGYPVGRIVFELMRSDEANHILGVRVNVWVSILVFLLGVFRVWAGRHRPVALPDPGQRREAERASQDAE